MKIVELTLNEKAEAGVDAVALVEGPAIEQDFYAFNAQKYYFETYNDYPQKVRDNTKFRVTQMVENTRGIKEYYVFNNVLVTEISRDWKR